MGKEVPHSAALTTDGRLSHAAAPAGHVRRPRAATNPVAGAAARGLKHDSFAPYKDAILRGVNFVIGTCAGHYSRVFSACAVARGVCACTFPDHAARATVMVRPTRCQCDPRRHRCRDPTRSALRTAVILAS